MRYGERLKLAMEHRSGVLQRKISNPEVAKAAGVTRQNIGMIIKGTQGEDQKLGVDANYKAAMFLRVDARWLATEEGDMLKGVAPDQDSVTVEAKQLDLILRAIPADRRAAAYQAATQILISHLVPADTIQPAASTTEAPAPHVAAAKPFALSQR